MFEVVLLLVAVPMLLLVLHFERTEQRFGLVPSKGLLSALFVLMGLIQQSDLDAFRMWVLLGLTFSFLGDVSLALPSKVAFLIGLVLFLVGHVFYVVAFLSIAVFSAVLIPVVLVLLVIATVVFIWLRPHVGSLLVPVLAYMVVISAMVACAVAVALNPDLPTVGRVTILIGAVAFYLSDLFVARDRFVDRNILNRRIGLPFYYTGQFLIALSIGALSSGVLLG